MAAVAASPPWVIMDRVALVWQDDEEDPRDISVSFVAPPRVSILTVPTRIHPDPGEYDRHPYIVAADPAGLLIHLASWPFVGFDFECNPPGILVMVLDFLPAVAGRHVAPTGTAIRVPNRVQPAMPGISNLRNVGLVSLPGSGGAQYIIAELQVVKGTDADRARLFTFRSGTLEWVEQDLLCPAWGRSLWATHDVISLDGKLWCVDLRLGLLTCDPFDDHPVLRYEDLPVLSYEDLPEAIALDEQPWLRDHASNRCVRVSKGMLRYVEITRARGHGCETAMVVMWTLVVRTDGLTRWEQQYETSLAEIWAADSYTATGMPKKVPALALVSPRNPDVVYFFLEQYLFGLNVPAHNVVEFVYEPCDLVDPIASLVPPPPPVSWRYVLAWELPPSLSNELSTSRAHHCQEELTLRDKAAQLRRSEDALKGRVEVAVAQHCENTLKRLEEALLQREPKQDDSAWDKTQLVLFGGVLITGLTILFQFWPWFPRECVSYILAAFGMVWVLGSIALPCALFGAHKYEKGFGRHLGRFTFMWFSLFVLYGLYRMSVLPDGSSSEASSPPSASGAGPALAPTPCALAGREWILYTALAIAVLLGHIVSWVLGCLYRR